MAAISLNCLARNLGRMCSRHDRGRPEALSHLRPARAGGGGLFARPEETLKGLVVVRSDRRSSTGVSARSLRNRLAPTGPARLSFESCLAS